jgi:hypothetical protein
LPHAIGKCTFQALEIFTRGNGRDFALEFLRFICDIEPLRRHCGQKLNGYTSQHGYIMAAFPLLAHASGFLISTQIQQYHRNPATYNALSSPFELPAQFKEFESSLEDVSCNCERSRFADFRVSYIAHINCEGTAGVPSSIGR